MILSGGIHDTYHGQIASNISKQTPITSFWTVKTHRFIGVNRAIDECPNEEELFEIIEAAVEQHNIVGANSLIPQECLDHGVAFQHQYAIIGAFYATKEKTSASDVSETPSTSSNANADIVRTVKLHNPNNIDDSIKKYASYIFHFQFIKKITP